MRFIDSALASLKVRNVLIGIHVYLSITSFRMAITCMIGKIEVLR
ncbi:MAG: hypothetical protein QOF09_2162 [Alphaproteobacteria bacterium]|jgi:hypothetical protein|nr:hypothetical protein [Alphaproteobacteria bacterium]